MRQKAEAGTRPAKPRLGLRRKIFYENMRNEFEIVKVREGRLFKAVCMDLLPDVHYVHTRANGSALSARQAALADQRLTWLTKKKKWREESFISDKNARLRRKTQGRSNTLFNSSALLG